MPTNLIKTYNQLLELNSLDEHQRMSSLKGVFKRDFVSNSDFSFRKKKLNPTPAEGEDTMERFFRHLTTVITDKATRKREYDPSRSVRLHWVRYHLEERKKITCQYSPLKSRKARELTFGTKMKIISLFLSLFVIKMNTICSLHTIWREKIRLETRWLKSGGGE